MRAKRNGVSHWQRMEWQQSLWFCDTLFRSKISFVLVCAIRGSFFFLKFIAGKTNHERPLLRRAAMAFATVAPAPTAPLMVGASGFDTSPTAKTFSMFASCVLDTVT